MFAGSLVALVTPMHPDGSLNLPCLGELIEWHISQNTNGIVINGTTGESVTLERAEQQEIIQFTVDCVNNRIPVIAGTGGNCTAHALARTQMAFDLGVDACLIVTPYYNKPTQEGLYQHYRAIVESVAGPIILYNVPSRTACDMQTETVIRLAVFPNVVAIKEASGNHDRYVDLVNRCGAQLDILSGDDATALDLMRLGGKGVISVTANVVPAIVSNMCRAALANDWATAQALEQQVAGLNQALFVESNPIPVKWALQQMGKISEGIRLPLTPLSANYHATVLSALQQSKVL